MKPLVVIIGAGPAGLVAASTFAQAGCDVQVHERRPGPPDPAADHQHSYTIVLNPKGLTALNSVGAEQNATSCRALGLPLRACVRHAAGLSHAFLEPQPGRTMAVERSELTLWLYTCVRTQHPEAVRFFFGSSLLGLDLERKEARVGPPPRSQDQGEAVPGVPLGGSSCQGQGEGAGVPGISSPTEDDGGAADYPLSLTAEEPPVVGGTSPLEGSGGVRTIRCGGGRVNRCWSRPCMRP